MHRLLHRSSGLVLMEKFVILRWHQREQEGSYMQNRAGVEHCNRPPLKCSARRQCS